MYSFKNILFSFVALCFQNVFSQSAVNDTEYYLMPSIHDYHNFDECHSQGVEYQYCLFEIELYPMANESSRIWDIIERVTNDRRSFEHNKLRKGRCVLNNLTKSDIIDQFTEIFNIEFVDDGIEVRVNELYCNKFQRKLDLLDTLALYGLAAWILFILICSFLSILIQRKVKKSNSVKLKLLQSFSLKENWHRLTTKDNGRRTYDYIHSIRFFIMLAIIFAHVILLGYNKPFQNPQFFEQDYQSWIKNSVRFGVICIQTFFLFSGIFLAQPFYGIMDRMKFRIDYIIGSIIGRYIRLTPAYFAVVLFNMTLMYYLNNGYIWEELIGNERKNCRQYWWLNMLYINNIFQPNTCITVSWYLAADFQLYIASLFILSLIWMMKKYKFVILAIALVISIIIPGIITYVYELEPQPLFFPRIARGLMTNSETFYRTYIQSYTNASSYILGLFVGYFYYTEKIDKPLFKFFNNIWFQIFCLLGLLFVFLAFLPLVGNLLYSDTFKYDVILTVMYAAFSKLMYSIVTGLILYALHQKKLGCFFKNFLEWRPFVALGRLTFCMYLVHWPYLFIRTASELSVVHYTRVFQVDEIVSCLIFIIILSLIFNLFVEGPVSALVTVLKSLFWKTEEEDKVKRDDIKVKRTSELEDEFNLKYVAK